MTKSFSWRTTEIHKMRCDSSGFDVFPAMNCLGEAGEVLVTCCLCPKCLPDFDPSWVEKCFTH